MTFKKLTALVLFVGLTYTTNAQVQTPQSSPFSKVEQKVGLTDITIEYSRPGVKGRTIFGNIVPYGKIWRTGANSRTKITLSDAITIDGKELKAGSYAILSIPTETSWELIFYTDYKNGGAPKELVESKIALRTNAKVQEVPFNVESFTIDINTLRDTSATLDLMWEKTYVSIPFTVPTDLIAVATIDKIMAGPSANDYYSAAVYYLNSGKDLNKAKQWVDKAIEMREKPAFWQIRQQSLIYAKLGDKKGAIKAAEKSLELAKKAGNTDYIKMNKASIAEWTK